VDLVAVAIITLLSARLAIRLAQVHLRATLAVAAQAQMAQVVAVVVQERLAAHLRLLPVVRVALAQILTALQALLMLAVVVAAALLLYLEARVALAVVALAELALLLMREQMELPIQAVAAVGLAAEIHQELVALALFLLESLTTLSQHSPLPA
jgi:hypothetical protein